LIVLQHLYFIAGQFDEVEDIFENKTFGDACITVNNPGSPHNS